MQSQKTPIDDLSKRYSATSSRGTGPSGTEKPTSNSNLAANTESKEAPLGLGGDGKASSSAVTPVPVPVPVVRASNIDLQSQLRNLLKCGNSSNIQNPFTARKITSPAVEGNHRNLSE